MKSIFVILIFNIRNFEISKCQSFYISSFKILSPTHNFEKKRILSQVWLLSVVIYGDFLCIWLKNDLKITQV